MCTQGCDQSRCYNQTCGLANHVMDLNVANLLSKSPRSHGLHSGVFTVPPEPEEFGSVTANSVSVIGRFLELDN